jgi:DNA-directed RNA polymerase specialized sigma subunit
VDYELDGMPSERSAEDLFMDAELVRLIEELVDTMDERTQFILNHTLCLNKCDYMEKKDIAKQLNVQMTDFTRYRREAYRKLKQAMARRRGLVDGKR